MPPNTSNSPKPTNSSSTDKKGCLTVCFINLAVLLFFLSPAAAQLGRTSDSQRLFSPSIAQKFHEIACELAAGEQLRTEKTEQAILFLRAAAELESSGGYLYPDMLRFASRPTPARPTAAADSPNDISAEALTQRNNSELLHNLLKNYVNQSADLELTSKAIRYLLESLNQREQREELLKKMLLTVGDKNPWLESELAAHLGLLMAEKADVNSAKVYFLAAYNKNKYNQLAFTKLTELMPEQITDAAYLEHLRLALVENPLDIEAAVAFAQYLQNLQLFETAAESYQYCAELFNYLNPSRPLPASIYLPWAISSYNSPRNQHKALQIAGQLRQPDRVDLLLETIAARAAAKTGDLERCEQILTQAEEKALRLSLENQQLAGYERLAWFYCFARPDPNKAINWANKAYSAGPDSVSAAGLLAYALVMNDQNEWAKLLTDNYRKHPIVDLAAARIQLASDQRDLAIQTLKSVIIAAPGSLEAEQAAVLLASNNAEYIPPVEPDIILTTLKNNFSYAPVPQFIRPAEVISVQLNLRGTKFSYGKDFSSSVVITNKSSQPLVISETSLFKGNIRVDAEISGDLNRKIPNLVSLRIRPSSPIEPGSSILVPVRLRSGLLRQILLSSPQASLNIKFTVILDAITTEQDKPASALGIEPVTLTVKRAAVKLDTKFLQNRLDTISKGRQGQKIKVSRLFAGLLAEQQQMANRDPLYKFMYADWMGDLLKSALLYNLKSGDWVVKTNTMTDILPLPLDYELIAAVSENLNDTDHWPVRLMGLFLLAENQNDSFNRVLDWTAQHDSNPLVSQMATALVASASSAQ